MKIKKYNLLSLQKIVTREITNEKLYEQTRASKVSLMSYITELESRQKREHIYANTVPKFFIKLYQGNIENNCKPFIEMEQFMEIYRVVKSNEDQMDPRLDQARLQQHLKQVFYALNYFTINSKVSNIVGDSAKKVIKFTLNPLSFFMSYIQVQNRIVTGDKLKLYEEVIKTYLLNEKFICKLHHQKEVDSPDNQFLFILEFFQSIFIGKST